MATQTIQSPTEGASFDFWQMFHSLLRLEDTPEAVEDAKARYLWMADNVVEFRETIYDPTERDIFAMLWNLATEAKEVPSIVPVQAAVEAMPKNEGMLFDLETYTENIDAYTQFPLPDLNHALNTLKLNSASRRLTHTFKYASGILSAAGMPDTNSRVKDAVLQGPQAAMSYVMRELEKGSVGTVSYEPEKGEVELFSGRNSDGPFSLMAIPATAIEAKITNWLWPDVFPLGAMSLLAGKQNNGKSISSRDVVARTTNGTDWPDGSKNTLGPRKVLMLCAEDVLETTVKPQLMAAGADISKIYFLTKVCAQVYDQKKDESKKEIRRLELAKDVEKIRQLLEADPEIALVVCDTLRSYFGNINSSSDREVGPVLDALSSALGDCESCCFLGIIHHNKRSDTDAVQSILGASSVAGVVRAAFSCARDPENKEEFFFSYVKGNLTGKRTGMKFKTPTKPVQIQGKDVPVPYAEWLHSTDEDANDVMALEKESRGNKNQQIDKARLFLPMVLEKGPRLARELFNEAKAEGISEQQLKRAKYELGNVQTSKRKDGWIWYLPGEAQEKNFLVDQAEL